MKPVFTTSLSRLITLTVFIFFLFAPCTYALPSQEQVISGDATFERSLDGTTLNITTSQHAIIEYNSFNIDVHESVNFNMPSTDSFSLNRVMGGQTSRILGSLKANGNLILVNPSGFYFGGQAQVEAHGLMVSTHDIRNADFLAGNYIFSSAHAGAAGSSLIVNDGTLRTHSGGFAVLIADAIRNQGVVESPIGTVALAAGNKVRVGLTVDGAISVVIEEETASRILDANGQPILDQISNSGTLSAQGGTVLLNAQSVDQIFESAINLEGFIRTEGFAVGEDGIVRVVASGALKAGAEVRAGKGDILLDSGASMEIQGIYEAGNIAMNSGTDLEVTGEITAYGSTTLSARGDLKVSDDITVDSGNLELLADSDLDGQGAFLQAPDTTIRTLNSGNITIQASGESTLAHIVSAGDFILKMAGAEVTFSQHPGSRVEAKGSIMIGTGVALAAHSTHYEVYKDWINLGSFLAGTSSVRFSGLEDSRILGNNTFQNLEIIVPGKNVYFEAGKVQEILGILTLTGGFGKLLNLHSTAADIPWNINPLGSYNVDFVDFKDSANINIHGPPAVFSHVKNSGGNSGWNFSETGFVWTGNNSLLWSDPLNWDVGVIPGSYDNVRFTGESSSSIIDNSFSGEINELILEPSFEGSIALSRDLTVKGDVVLSGGTLAAGSSVLRVGGSWTLDGGVFNAEQSTVIFTDADQITTLRGNSTFNNLFILTPGKVIQFEAGSTQTILGTWRVDGEYFPAFVKVVSTEPGSPWYIDPRGERELFEIWIEDAHNINPLEVYVAKGTNRGGSFHIDPTFQWTGGDTVNQDWSDGDNWDQSGATPGSGDDVLFNTTSFENSTVDASFGGSVGSVSFGASGYTGTLTLARSLTTTTSGGRTGNFTLNTTPATVTCGANALTVEGTLSITGGTFNAPSSNLTVAGNLDISSTGVTFNNNSGTVVFSKTSGIQTFTSGGNSFHNVTHSGSGELDLGSDLTVTNNLTNNAGSFDLNGKDLTATGATFSNAAGAEIAAQGDEAITGLTQDTDSGTWSFYGNEDGTQDTFTIFDFGTTDYFNLSIDSDTGTADIFRITSALGVAGALAVEAGTFNANGNTATVTGTTTVSGGTYLASTATQTFNGAFSISSGTFTGSSGTVDLNSNFTQSGGTFTAPSSSGSFTVSGNWSKTAGTFTHNSGTVTFDGTGTQTFDSGSSTFSGISHNNTGTLQLTGNLTVIGSFSNTGGTFDLNGKNWTMTGATFSNTARVALNFSEVITGLTQDTDSGTFDFVAVTNAITNTITLTDFGSTDFFNLTLSGTPDSTDVVQLGNSLAIAGAFTNSTTTGTFNDNGFNVTITGAASFTGTGTYTATTATLTLNGGVTFSGAGIFNAGSSIIDINGNFTASDGTFNANSSTIRISGDIAVSGGTFNESTSTLVLDGGNASIDLNGTETLNNLTFAPATAGATKTIANSDTLIVTGTLTLTEGNIDQSTIPSGGTVAARGGIIQDSTFDGGTGLLVIDGTGTQTLSGGGSTSAGSLPDLSINKSTGSLSLSGTIRTTNDLTYVAGSVSPGSSNFVFAGNLTLDPQGSSTQMNFNDVEVNGGTTTLGGDLEVSDDLTITTGTLDVSGSNFGITVNGDWIDTGAGTFTSRSGTVTFGGTGTINSNDSFHNVTVNTTGTVTLGGAFTAGGSFALSNGTFNASGNTSSVTGAAAISSGTYQSSTATNTFGSLSLSGSGNFTGGSGTVDVNGAFTLNTSGTFTAPSGKLQVSGNFTHTAGTFTHNSGTVILDGGDQIVNGTTTFNNFSKTNSSDTLTFLAGAGNQKTFVGTLTLRGASAGSPLKLRSSATPTQWSIDAQGSTDIQFVDVKDSSSAAAITAVDSVDSGNNTTNWSFVSSAKSTTSAPSSTTVSTATRSVDTTTEGSDTESSTQMEEETGEGGDESGDGGPGGDAVDDESEEESGDEEQEESASGEQKTEESKRDQQYKDNPWNFFGTERVQDFKVEVRVYEGKVEVTPYLQDGRLSDRGTVVGGNQTTEARWNQSPETPRSFEA